MVDGHLIGRGVALEALAEQDAPLPEGRGTVILGGRATVVRRRRTSALALLRLRLAGSPRLWQMQRLRPPLASASSSICSHEGSSVVTSAEPSA